MTIIEHEYKDPRSQELLLRSSLVELSQVASTAGNFDQVYETLTSLLKRFLAFDRLAIRLLDEKSATVTNAFVSGADMEGWRPGETHELKNTITSELIARGTWILFKVANEEWPYSPSGTTPAASRALPSLLAVPLISRGNMLGAIYLRSRTAGAFTEEHAELVETFATHIAPAIENSLHVQGLAAEAEKRKLMLELGRTITSSLDIDSVFERFSELVSQLIPADRIIVTALDADGESFIIRFGSGLEFPERSPGNRMSLKRTVTEAAIKRNGPFVLHVNDPADLEEALEEYPVLEPILDGGIRSVLASPMVSEGRVIGTFHIQSKTPLAYNFSHHELIQQVAAFAASAVAKADLMQRIERESRERHVLAEIGRLIGSTLDFGDVFERVADEVRKLLKADRIVVTTVDDEAGTITDRYISGTKLPGWDSQRSKQLSGLPTEKVVRERRATITFSDDLSAVAARTEGLQESREVGLHSTMFAPLVSADRVIGTISVKASATQAYAKADLEALKAIAQQIAGAVAASDLYLETLRLADERERRQQAESDNRELQKVNQAKSEFLSTVSHELKTPLTSILAFTGVLRKALQDELSEREANHFAVIKRNGEQLDRLISDLVDVSRVQANTIALTPSRFDLNETLKELVESFGPVIAAKSQSITVYSPDGELRLYADSDRVTQVISNLISNASKYSSSGSEITVSVEPGTDQISICVSDQGIGVSEEDRRHLFTAFFRADNEITRKQPGTGLGLVIAKAIAEMHHGDLTVQSEPNSGSTFRFTVPYEYRPG